MSDFQGGRGGGGRGGARPLTDEEKANASNVTSFKTDIQLSASLLAAIFTRLPLYLCIFMAVNFTVNFDGQNCGRWVYRR